MDVAALLTDAHSRILETVHAAVDGLSAEQLGARLAPEANSVAWLVWHLTRVQDDHVADVAGFEQVWTAQAFAGRFGLALPVEDTGYGHSPDDVAAVRVDDPGLLLAYYDAVHEQTAGYLAGLREADLDRVIDERWNPPVTLGVRLVSVIDDDQQHAGQAVFARGVLLQR